MKALLTGANSLVNKELLQKLVDMGYDVTAHYHNDNDITAEVRKAHLNVRFIQADFSDQDSFMKFIEQAMDGKYDVLVNAAVYYAEAADWKVQQDWAAWQKTFAINTTTAGVLMAHADLSLNDGGVIVNISSTYGQTYMGDTQFTMYGASKAALDLLTENYAKRWHSKGIRVVGIAPGWVRSAWNKDMSADDIKAMVSADHLVTKLIEPQEIADLMEQLIKNNGINATTVVIDGGLSSPIV
jgi:NAD(P)-dependent dehydrogenase (short-subunit alcohol dehydrogenase family)